MTMINPPHPGRFIEEAISELDISVRDLAKALHVAPSTIQRVIVGNASITPEMAVKLAKVLGSTSAMWLRLQSEYSLSKAEKEVDVSALQPLFKGDELNHSHIV